MLLFDIANDCLAAVIYVNVLDAYKSLTAVTQASGCDRAKLPQPPSRSRLCCRLRRTPVHTNTTIRPTSATSSNSFSRVDAERRPRSSPPRLAVWGRSDRMADLQERCVAASRVPSSVGLAVPCEVTRASRVRRKDEFLAAGSTASDDHPLLRAASIGRGRKAKPPVADNADGFAESSCLVIGDVLSFLCRTRYAPLGTRG